MSKRPLIAEHCGTCGGSVRLEVDDTTKALAHAATWRTQHRCTPAKPAAEDDPAGEAQVIGFATVERVVPRQVAAGHIETEVEGVSFLGR